MIQVGAAANIEGEELANMDFIEEEKYLDILEDPSMKDNHNLDDSDPNKFIAKMGAEALHDLLKRLDLEDMSYKLRIKAETETSVQRKNEALKRLQVVEAMRDSQKRIENNP